MPENNVNNENNVVTTEPVASAEPVAMDIPEKDDKGDIIVGIIGAGVCLLAVPTVIRGVKWVWGKVSGFLSKRKEKDEGFDEEFESEE